MGYGFNKLPSWWVYDPTYALKSFLGGRSAGESIASLKILLAITTDVEYKSSNAVVTYDYIEEVAGISRPMIKKALDKLQFLKIVEVLPHPENKKVKIYHLVEMKKGQGWAKLPRDRVKNKLRDIPSRGKASLSALKIYVTLLAFRTNRTRRANASYETLRVYTGLQSSDIRQGLDILINHGFIHIDQRREENLSNSYELLGIVEEG
jgi:hypothetical protein